MPALLLGSAVLLTTALALAGSLAPPPAAPSFNARWEPFLARSDVTSAWSRPAADGAWVEPGPPFSYDTAAFLGNGNVGAMVQATPNGSVTLVLGRTDVYDRRVPGSPFAVDSLLCDVAKLPIGNLTLHTVGDVLSATTRMRLWDGEVTVQLATTAGSVSARLLAFGGASAPSAGGSGVIVAASNSSGGEAAARWLFTAADANANAPHPVYKTESYACSAKTYKENPAAARDSQGDIATWTQRLLAGPTWASALGRRGGLTVLSTTPPVRGGATAAKALAVADTAWALGAWTDGSGSTAGLLAEHRTEWHRYYTNASFLSIDHPRLEQFYWVTQYKLASGMGLRGDLAGDGGAMDHTSPWYLPNNGLFNWDLNIEMTWWSVAGANRPQLIEPLLRLLERNAPSYCENVVAAARDPHGCQPRSSGTPFAALAGPSAHTGYISQGRIQVGHGTPSGASNRNRSIEPPGPLGDLVWTLQNVEQTWRMTRNITTARRLWPLLSGAVHYYIHWLSANVSSPPVVGRVAHNINFHADNIIVAPSPPGPAPPVHGCPRVNYTTYEGCQAACDALARCDMWTYVPPHGRPGAPWCCLKSCRNDSDPSCPIAVPDQGCVSGVKRPRKAPPSSDPSGRYHLPPTHSPEYLKGPGDGDTSYELAIARWGLGAAVSLAAELGIKDDPRIALWKDRHDNLANYSTDPVHGLDVAKNLPFDIPHRHFSHLMGVVLKEPALCADTKLVATSVDNWRSYRDPCAMAQRPASTDPGFVGFSYAVSAMLNARLQRPAIAAHDITWMAEHSAVEGKAGAREGPMPLPPRQCAPRGPMLGSTFHANTFYAEGVGDPTGETPFGTAAALQEFLVGTAPPDGRIVAFPGFGNGSVPTKLSKKACFHDLRVEGAFVVSGCYVANATSFVSVLSEAGQPCRLELPSLRRPVVVLPTSVAMMSDGGVVELKLGAGQRATLYTQGDSTEFAVSAVEIGPGESNFWGQKPLVAQSYRTKG